MKTLLIFLIIAGSALAQTPISGHPRLLINDQIADTWDPSGFAGSGSGRLSAMVSRICGNSACSVAGTSAAQYADWTGFIGELPISAGNPYLGGAPDGNLSLIKNYALAYALYHKSGNDAAANPFAAALWASMTGPDGSGSLVYTITSIVVSGTTATVTLATMPSPVLTTSTYAAVWGASTDALSNSAGCYSCVVITGVTGNTFTYTTAGSPAPGTYTGPTMLLAVRNTGNYIQWIGGIDEDGYVASALSGWAYFYDWCYPWLVANRHDQYARNQLEAGYWNVTLTRASTQFGSAVREADFHNHASWDICALIEAGVAIYGDDAVFGPMMFAESAGYVYAGQAGISPVSGVPESYTYNLAVSAATLTGGALNWEGPGYWREAATNHVRAIEAFDTATGRALNIWGTKYPTVKNAGWYKLYTLRPDGWETAFGDAGPTLSYTGRDNAGLVIINDRFPDAHFVYTMTTSPTNDWNMGNEGSTGLDLKLIFFPYVGGPGSHDYTDLPLSMQLGPDIILRSAWTGNPSIYTYTNSVRGVYHRHEDSGSFTVWKGRPLIAPTPYTAVEPQQTMHNRRTIGANSLTIYDPNDCWKQESAFCGQFGDYGDLLISNDGGQLMSERRLGPQFAAPNLTTDLGDAWLSRIWSGTLFSDPTYGTLYSANDAIAAPLFASVSGTYDSIHHNLTSLYVNTYTGTGDNPAVKVSSTNGVVRSVIHFQPTQGTLDPLVTFDVVTATDASFKKSWSIHTVGAPTVNSTLMSPGDTTTANASVTKADNGTARVYVNHLLPATPNVRTVGGNACTPVQIVSCTSANPSVCYAPSHGLKANENIEIQTGAVYYGTYPTIYFPIWNLDPQYGGTWSTGAIPDPDHFQLYTYNGGNAIFQAYDASSLTAWATAFTSGSAAPSSMPTNGYIYYQTGATGGNTVWMADGSAWRHLSSYIGGYPSGLGLTAPTITGHASCEWPAYVDQLGPPAATVMYSGGTTYGVGDTVLASSVSYASLQAGNHGNIPSSTPPYMWWIPYGSAHLWTSDYDGQGYQYLTLYPQWAIMEQPSTNELTDYFLNVTTPTTTSASSAPTTSLISGTGVYGALIADSGGDYVAMFSTNPSGVGSMAYIATHSGTAQHVASGLTAGIAVVKQGGTTIATRAVDSSGAVPFTETGGGTFQVNVGAAAPGGSSTSAGAVNSVGTIRH